MYMTITFLLILRLVKHDCHNMDNQTFVSAAMSYQSTDVISRMERPDEVGNAEEPVTGVAIASDSISPNTQDNAPLLRAGILMTLLQLAIAYTIILFTVLSLCAISTNGAIEGGGVYCYTVDDALPSGHWWEFAYGLCVSILLLMFARTSALVLIVVIVSYCSFLLSLMIFFNPISVPLPENNPFGRLDINGTLIKNLTAYANYTGVRSFTFLENLYPNWSVDYTTGIHMTFALVFAVVFSGITGLMAGANMSGELKQPNISIPKGTLQALLATFLVYFLTTFLIGASCSNVLLQNNYIVMQNINVWPPFIFIGIVAATLAAALSNLIGASRVLFRLAVDRLFGVLLHVATFHSGGNPVMAVFMSWILVVAVLLIGSFNVIAQITSVLFLLSYAAVNLACLALDLTSAPNFRPTFRYFSVCTSFCGFAGCIAMMFVVNPVSSGVAIIFLLLLLICLHYVAPMPASWGSISQALIFHQVRKYLLMLDPRKEHVKFWRPQVLLLVANPRSCLPLIDFVNDLKKSGLYVIGHVKSNADDNEQQLDPAQQDMPYWLGLVDYLKIKAFIEITVAKTIREGVCQLIRLSGIGAMKPNTVILGFHDSTPSQNTFDKGRFLRSIKFAKLERAEVVEYFTGPDLPTTLSGTRLDSLVYVQLIRDVLRMNKNVVLARHFQLLDKEKLLFGSSGRCYVDVWPVDITQPEEASLNWDNSSLFVLQLACILSMAGRWKNRSLLRVFISVTSVKDMQCKEAQLREMLNQLRISAQSVILPCGHVIYGEDDSEESYSSVDQSGLLAMPRRFLRCFNQLLRKQSSSTGVVFLNLPPPPADPALSDAYLKCLECITDGLPPTLLIHGIGSVISTAL
ncbi:Solute carrier family 12 member 9 [Trichinella pseudospiralis]|uniref:Solute carrier family 12 member 9 n=1 Tax=Trichinella pseudospiralis TaxID=6337 RepID=A0A0V0YG20_TRIPS|nr:Solute carrier family 12 member 9 [Trichinella pseudospiralis]